jgi:hypothetical protein
MSIPTDQLIADVSVWAGVPGADSDTSGLGEDVVTTIGDLARLLDGFVEVAAFGGVPHGGAVQSAVEQLVLGGHAPLYRMQIRLHHTQRGEMVSHLDLTNVDHLNLLSAKVRRCHRFC